MCRTIGIKAIKSYMMFIIAGGNMKLAKTLLKYVVGFFIALFLCCQLFSHQAVYASVLKENVILKYVIYDKAGNKVGNYYIEILDWSTPTARKIKGWCDLTNASINIDSLPFCASDWRGDPAYKFVSLDENFYTKQIDIKSKRDNKTELTIISKRKPDEGIIRVTRRTPKGEIEFVINELLTVLSMEALLLSQPEHKQLFGEIFFWLEQKRAKRIVVENEGRKQAEYEGLKCSSCTKVAIKKKSASTGKTILQFTGFVNGAGYFVKLEPQSGDWGLALERVEELSRQRTNALDFMKKNEKRLIGWINAKKLPLSEKIEHPREVSYTRAGDDLEVKIVELKGKKESLLKQAAVEALRNKLAPSCQASFNEYRVQLPRGYEKRGLSYQVNFADACDNYRKIYGKQIDKKCQYKPEGKPLYDSSGNLMTLDVSCSAWLSLKKGAVSLNELLDEVEGKCTERIVTYINSKIISAIKKTHLKLYATYDYNSSSKTYCLGDSLGSCKYRLVPTREGQVFAQDLQTGYLYPIVENTATDTAVSIHNLKKYFLAEFNEPITKEYIKKRFGTEKNLWFSLTWSGRAYRITAYKVVKTKVHDDELVKIASRLITREIMGFEGNCVPASSVSMDSRKRFLLTITQQEIKKKYCAKIEGLSASSSVNYWCVDDPNNYRYGRTITIRMKRHDILDFFQYVMGKKQSITCSGGTIEYSGYRVLLGPKELWR